jgi:NitT/TauT family transport system permease protein
MPISRMFAPGSARFVSELAPNRWDIVLLPLVVASLFLISWGTGQMAQPYRPGEALPVSLAIGELPGYALRTTLRMAAAMLASLLFTVVYASAAAKSERLGRILIPLLDVLQSVPILGFMSITVVGFIRLFPGSLLGPEFAAIFAIFTSQAWNMAFSFYSSLRTVPRDLYDAADAFGLSAWQRLWRLELPYALPQLVWNTMMSAAGGWFFVVAAEAISVEGYDIRLPGIGSYIALAIQREDMAAIGWAIVAMLAVIVATDQLVFRPLVAWSERFKFEFAEAGQVPRSWLLDVLRRSRAARLAGVAMGWIWERSLSLLRGLRARPVAGRRWSFVGIAAQRSARLIDRHWSLLLAIVAGASIILLAHFVLSSVAYSEIAQVFLLGLWTALRVAILVLLASLVWVPIGIWIGLNARFAQRVQPVIVFLAAFPANLIFPLAVTAILQWRLNPEIWLSPLMILGTQWYILFNVIGGAMALPADLREAAASLGVSRMLAWRRVLLPAILPAYVTGGLTASGGAWNASVVAEVVNWGTTTLAASGIGAYIAAQTRIGDHPRIALGVAVMSLYVVLVNRVLWERLYSFVRERFAYTT